VRPRDVPVPILRDFERRLGGLVEGLFSKTFRSGVQPVELAKRILREMDTGRTVGVSENWAPNHFELSLSPEDAERFEQAESAIVAELRQVVRDNAAERGWGLVGPPEVELVVDDGLKRGDIGCVASLVEGAERIEPAAGGRGSLLIHEDDGEREVGLAAEVLTIGRLPDCDVILADKGASRRHAQLKRQDGSWTITDLGSTNGTQLNGQTIQSRELGDGDRITIGTTVIEFRER
jgi:hypothetical protein